MAVRPLLATAVLVTALAATSSTARAEGETEWYGYQIIGTDVAGVTLSVVGVKSESVPVAAIGLAALFLGGPIVHVAHGNYGRAGISFGIRSGGTLLGGLIGAKLASGGSHDAYGLSALAGLAVGAFVGFVTAEVIDIAVVAREEKDDPLATPRMLSFGGRF